MNTFQKNLLNLGYFVGVAFLSGTTFLVLKLLLKQASPLSASMLRLTFGFLSAGIGTLLFTRQIPVLRGRVLWETCLGGLLMFGIPSTFLCFAQARVFPGQTGIAMGSVPLWTLLIGALFYRGKLEIKKIIGIFLGLAGLVIMTGNSHLQGVSGEATGMILLLATVLCLGVGSNYNKRYFERNPDIISSTCLFYQFLSSSLLAIAVTFFVEGPNLPWFPPSLKTMMLIVYLGLGSTYVLAILIYKLFKTWGAVKTTSYTLLVPPIAIGLDFLYYQRVPSTTQMSSMLLVLMGIFLVLRK